MTYDTKIIEHHGLYGSYDDAPLEYGGHGYITHVGGMKVRSRLEHDPRTTFKTKAIHQKHLEGYACIYGKPHVYKGSVEVFVRGCFDETLSSNKDVSCLVDHEAASLVATRKDCLELLGDDTGLAFRVRFPHNDIGAEVWDLVDSRAKMAMSVGYSVRKDEWKEIDGTPVRFLFDVGLTEISICNNGAVRQAHVSLVEPDGLSLRAACKDGALLRENSFVNAVRALQKLADAVS